MKNKALQKQTWSELQQAVVANNKQRVEEFLQINKKPFCKKAILNTSDSKPGWNALQIAACLGHYEIFCMMIKKLGKTNPCFNPVGEGKEKGWNCLHIAGAAGHHKIVAFILLELTTSTLQKTTGVILQTIEHGQFKNWNALHLAAYHGHTEVVKNLLCQQDEEERIEVTLTRIQHGINYLPFKANLSALHLAFSQNHTNVIRAFLNFTTKKSILNLIEKSTHLLLSETLDVFQLSVFHGHVEIVAHILKVLATDPTGIETLITKVVATRSEISPYYNLNAFHIACMEGHVSIVNMFIQILGNKVKDVINHPFHRSSKIYNAVILTSEQNHEALIYLLIKNGGSCNYDFESIKSLYWALQIDLHVPFEWYYQPLARHLAEVNDKILNIINKIDRRIHEVTRWAYEHRAVPEDIKIYICTLALEKEIPGFPADYLRNLIKENLTVCLQKTQSIISFSATQKHRDRFFKIDNEAFFWGPKTFLLKAHLIFKLLQTFCQKMKKNYLARETALQLIQKISQTNLTEDEINSVINEYINTKREDADQITQMTTPLNNNILEKDLEAIAINSLNYCANNLSPSTAVFKYWEIVATDKKRLVMHCLKNFFRTNNQYTLTNDIAELLARNISKTYFLESEIVAAIQKTFDSIIVPDKTNDNNKRDLPPDEDSGNEAKRQKTK